jgi:hypothetical protein
VDERSTATAVIVAWAIVVAASMTAAVMFVPGTIVCAVTA